MGSLALWRWRAARAGHQAKARAWLSLKGARRGLSKARQALTEAVPLALHLAAILIGWGGLTQAVVALSGRPDVVWPASVGIAGLSLSGWGHLKVVASFGVYALWRKEQERDR